MKRSLFFLSTALLTPSLALAAESRSLADLLGSDANVAAAKGKIVDAVENAANDLFAAKAPFLKLNYLGNDDDSESDGFTLDYDWSRKKSYSRDPNVDLASLAPGESRRYRFVSSALGAEAKGSYSHEDTGNINNLSTAGLSLSAHVIDDGWLVKLDDPAAINRCIGELDLSVGQAAYDAASQNCVKAYFDFTRSQQVHTYAYDLRLDYKVEANADYTEHQEVYGFATMLVFEPYRGSLLQQLNVFDYPFRFITRPLWSDESDYNARLPSLRVALEQVDPTKNTQRQALAGGGDRYDRWHAELAFATQVARLGGYPITFESSYRVWREVSAPAAIRAAELDEFRYGSAALYFPAGMFGLGGSSDFFLSYAHGRLPFDADTDEAIAIGWKSNLKDLLGNLLE